MRLILIRHGQTEWNRQRRIQGWMDSPLTNDAIDILNHMTLPPLNYPLIFSSDLGRASHSAQILADRLGVEVLLDERLRERRFGILEQKVIDGDKNLEACWQQYHRRYEHKISNILGVESEEQFEQRIFSFLSELSSLTSDADVVIVGHGEWLRAFCNIVNGLPSWQRGSGVVSNAQPLVLDWAAKQRVGGLL